MAIRKATEDDAPALKNLYFEHLTAFPPPEEQDMRQWQELLRQLRSSKAVTRSCC